MKFTQVAPELDMVSTQWHYCVVDHLFMKRNDFMSALRCCWFMTCICSESMEGEHISFNLTVFDCRM